MQVLASGIEKFPLNNIFMYKGKIFDCVDQRQPVFRDILPWTYETDRFNSSMILRGVT